MDVLSPRLCPFPGGDPSNQGKILGMKSEPPWPNLEIDLKDHQVPMTESLLGLQHSSATPCLDADITASQVVVPKSTPNKTTT